MQRRVRAETLVQVGVTVAEYEIYCAEIRHAVRTGAVLRPDLGRISLDKRGAIARLLVGPQARNSR